MSRKKGQVFSAEQKTKIVHYIKNLWNGCEFKNVAIA